MIPDTFSPVCKVLRDCSKSSSKLSVFSFLISSDIFLFTSLITESGVEAPAVMNTARQPPNTSVSSCPAFSINTVFLQQDRQSLYRLFELLLDGSPITMTPSDLAARIMASDCLNSVALHIVSKNSTSLQEVFNLFTNSPYFFMLKVVWATTEIGIRRLLPIKLSISSSVKATVCSPQREHMPLTSG